MPSARPLNKPTPQRQRAREQYEKIPRKLPADDPQAYTKVPHEYGDILISGGKLGGQLQRDLVYWIERHTIGNAKRPEFAKLSITAMARMCQVWDADKGKLRPVERKSVAVALADLERRKIIEARDRKGCGPTTAKMYKLTPEHWRKAKPYEPPTRKELEEAEATVEAEDAAEETTAPAPEAESTVQSGKMSRPQAVSIRPTRNAEPVTIRLVYNPNGFDTPVTFQARTGPNGRIQVSARPHKHSEAKANDYGCAQPQSFAVSSPPSEENKRFTDFDVCANSISLETWGIALEDELIRQIVTAAADAPVELFNRIARKKLETRTAHKDHTKGLLVHLAAEAARSHTKEKAIEARRAADRPAAPILPAIDPAELAEAVEREQRPVKPRCGKCRGTGKGKTAWTNQGGVYAPRPQPCPECRGTGEEVPA